MRLLWTTTLTLTTIYIVYALLLYFFQQSLIYPGQYRRALVTGTYSDERVTTIWLTNSFGKTEAWLIKAAQNDSANLPVMIMAHGNYELIEDCYDEAVRYSELGLHVFLVEYPGFGNSEGSPSYEKLLEVFIAAYDWIKSTDEYNMGKIIAYGRSLGGGPVCALAKHRNLDVIILQSAFSDIRKFARQYFLPGFLLHDHFNNFEILSSYQNPVLIMHGSRDQIIPIAHGRELHLAASHSDLIGYNCGHNDFPVFSDKHLQNIREFLIDHQILNKK